MQLAADAKAYRWPEVLVTLGEHQELINSTRPDGFARYTPLHQAAHGGAPTLVIEQLLGMGAWRTIRNARGERPVDVAVRRGYSELMPLLTPVLQTDVPIDVLNEIQRHFHAVIRGRAGELVDNQSLRLPELEPLLELAVPRIWFPIPGMYGGFSYWLDKVSGNPVIVTNSWWRIVGGSGECHVVSPHGSLLVSKGFV